MGWKMVLEHHLPYIGDTFHTLIAFISFLHQRYDEVRRMAMNDGDELMYRNWHLILLVQGGANHRKANKFNQEGDFANARERKGNINKGPKLRNQLWWQIRSSNSRLANFMQISLRRWIGWEESSTSSWLRGGWIGAAWDRMLYEVTHSSPFKGR